MVRMGCLIAALLMALALPAAAQPVQGRPCATTTVVTGGTAVIALTGPWNGFFIVNPLSASDQGIATAENLYIDPTSAATTTANGTVSALAPGTPFSGVAGSTGTISVTAATSGHKFTCVRW